jgi:hypothetical protein
MYFPEQEDSAWREASDEAWSERAVAAYEAAAERGSET